MRKATDTLFSMKLYTTTRIILTLTVVMHTLLTSTGDAKGVSPQKDGHSLLIGRTGLSL